MSTTCTVPGCNSSTSTRSHIVLLPSPDYRLTQTPLIKDIQRSTNVFLPPVCFPSSAAVHLSHLFILAQGQQAPRCRLSARVREHTAVGNSQQKFHSRSSQWAHSCVFIASHCRNESQIYSCGPVFEHFKRVINLCRLGVGGNNCMKAYISPPPPPKKKAWEQNIFGNVSVKEQTGHKRKRPGGSDSEAQGEKKIQVLKNPHFQKWHLVTESVFCRNAK